MSNIAALCYSDATRCWMSDTPLWSSHIRALTSWATAPASSCVGSAGEWRREDGLTRGWLRISAASGYRRPALLLLAVDCLAGEAFPWLSCSIVTFKDTAVLFFSTSCQHHLLSTIFLSRPSVACHHWWSQSRFWLSTNLFMEYFWHAQRIMETCTELILPLLSASVSLVCSFLWMALYKNG